MVWPREGAIGGPDGRAGVISRSKLLQVQTARPAGPSGRGLRGRGFAPDRPGPGKGSPALPEMTLHSTLPRYVNGSRSALISAGEGSGPGRPGATPRRVPGHDTHPGRRPQRHEEHGMATIHTPGDGLSDTKSMGWPRYTPRVTASVTRRAWDGHDTHPGRRPQRHEEHGTVMTTSYRSAEDAKSVGWCRARGRG